MTGVADRQIGPALGELASPEHPPAAGVATALTAAQAAALVELSAGLAAKRLSDESGGADAAGAERMGQIAGRAAALREELLEAADMDVAAYGEVAKAPDVPSRTDALALAADPPLGIAERAAEAAEAAAEVASRSGAWAFGADAVAACELASASARSAALLVSANLGSTSDDPRIARAREAAARADRASSALPANNRER